MPAETTRSGRNNELGRLGRTLVGRLFILLKTSLNYGEGHAAIEAPAANLLKVLREVARRNEEAALRVKAGNFYLGELRLKSDAASFEASRFVMDQMKRLLVGGLCFNPEVSAAELCRLVYVFREVDALGSPDSYGEVLELMQRREIVNIEVETLPQEVETVEIDREKPRDRQKSGRLNARLLYKKALNTMDEVMGNARSGQALRLRGAKRVVQRVIDLLPGCEAGLLGVTTTPCTDGRAQNHAVNVCILSIVMGRRLGMPKYHLCELGMAALFHDLGKADLPHALLDKQGELSAHERQAMEAHPIYGVRQMMRLKGLPGINSRIITGIFEHHLLADFSGYPRFRYQRLSLFGRIISIADCYDHLTSAKAGKGAYPPDKALRFLLTRAGKAYDLALLKLFINCVGSHAVGSLLLLDSGQLAVVVEHNPAKPENPRIRIIADSAGQEVEREAQDLLAQPGSPAVVATLDPHLFDLDVSRYFL
jgi:HD-GYP domain-containing protein (c-di-GMP phosphodiesterase class II)